MDKNPKTNKKKIKQECRQETFREANTRLYRQKCTIRKNKTTINKRQTDNRTNKRDNLEMSIDPAQGNKPSLQCFRSLACSPDTGGRYHNSLYIVYTYIDKVHLLYVFSVSIQLASLSNQFHLTLCQEIALRTWENQADRTECVSRKNQRK